MIRFSCHSENFPFPTPEESFSFIHALEYDCIDVSARTLIPQKHILTEPLNYARFIADLSERYQLPLSELFLSEVQVNGAPVHAVSDAAHTKDFNEAFETICQFAEAAGFLSIMGSCGNADPSLPYHESFDRIADTMTRQVKIASSHGLAFHVEPYRLSIVNTVEASLEMAAKVPGLKYTLDFLHFQIQGIPQSESMKLIPLAGHMHARQAKKDIGKCDFAEGEIDYPSIVEELKRQNWSGDITTEFWNTENLAQQGIQAVEQNIVMRHYLKTLLRQIK